MPALQTEPGVQVGRRSTLADVYGVPFLRRAQSSAITSDLLALARVALGQTATRRYASVCQEVLEKPGAVLSHQRRAGLGARLELASKRLGRAKPLRAPRPGPALVRLELPRIVDRPL